MKSLQVICLLTAMFALLASNAQAQHSNLSSYDVRTIPGTFNVLIEWSVVDTGIISGNQGSLAESFRLYRNTNGTDFRAMNARCIEQTGSDSFRCEDTDLYKSLSDETAASENVVYRLVATHSDGTEHEYFESRELEYNTHVVRRTWGDIKAMFQ